MNDLAAADDSVPDDSVPADDIVGGMAAGIEMAATPALTHTTWLGYLDGAHGWVGARWMSAPVKVFVDLGDRDGVMQFLTPCCVTAPKSSNKSSWCDKCGQRFDHYAGVTVGTSPHYHHTQDNRASWRYWLDLWGVNVLQIELIQDINRVQLLRLIERYRHNDWASVRRDRYTDVRRNAWLSSVREPDVLNPP